MLGSHHTLQNRQDLTPSPAPGSLWGPGWGGRGADPKRKLPGSSAVPVLLPVLLEIQCLQIASLNLVPCVLGGGPPVLSDESAPQSLGQRKHQWSHKPPTVQRGKTRLLQKRKFSPLCTSPAQRPSSYSSEGEE